MFGDFMISVIIPVYNSADTLYRCLKSIQDQTYHNFEVLIINDGSQDDSVNICESFVKEDNRFNLFSFSNHGVSWARNKGISIAQGKYLIFVDSDDSIENNMFQKLVNNATRADLVICGINAINIKKEISESFLYASGYYTKKEYLKIVQKYKLNPFIGGPYAKLFNKDILLRNSISFNEKHSFAEDFTFNIDVLNNVSSVYVVDETLYNYYFNQTNSLTVRNYKNFDIDFFWNQELYANNKYEELLAVNNVASDATLIAEFWDILICKVCKTPNMSIIYATKSINNILEKYSLKGQLRKSQFDTTIQKIKYNLLSSKTGIFLACLILKARYKNIKW